jgi:hypothetical protein
MSTPEQPPSGTPAQPTEPAGENGTQPMPASTAAVPGPVPPAAAPPGAWPPGWASEQPPPPRRHSAWIRTMTPLTAGILGLVLVLAGFGLGVVVGWQHDGHGTQRVVFGPERRGAPNQQQIRPGQRQYGPYFNGPGRQGQPGQQGQQGQTNPAPSPSASS